MSDPLSMIGCMEVARALEEPWQALDRAHADACSAELVRAEAAARLEDEQGIDDAEVPDISCAIAERCGVSTWTAMEWLRVGRALRTLPRIRAACAGGKLSWQKVRILTKFVDPGLDDEWANLAQRMRPGRLHDEARRHLRLRRDREQHPDHALRYLRLQWDDEKRFLQLQGSLAAEQGAAIEGALHRAAHRVAPSEEEAWDRRGARMADALEAVATGGSGGRAGQPTMVVHVDGAVLSGEGDGIAETDSGVQLTNDAVERLACHAKVRWVKEEDGRPVDIGRSGRRVGGALEDLVRFRDRSCRFPGCDRDWSAQAHHIKHWIRGGPTTLDNLVLLCGTHHRMVHRGRWRIEGRPGAEITFLDRKGRVLGTVSAGPPRRAGSMPAASSRAGP